MALELEGTLRQKLGVQQGTSARGQWAKQEFILEYPDGNYTSQVCMLAFGQDKVQELDKYQIGDRVKVSFNLKSREYNGRWYTDIQIWRIAPATPGAQAGVQPAAQPFAAGSPVGPSAFSAPAAAAPASAPSAPVAPAWQAPAPTLDDMPAEADSDDLPF